MSRAAAAFVVSILALLIAFGAGVLVGGHPTRSGLIYLPESLRAIVLGASGQDLSAQVLDVLEERYYREFDAAALEQSSVRHIIAALDDPFTTYLTAEQLAEQRRHQSGSYTGVGLQVAQRERAVVVAGVFPGGPAAEVDVRIGDVISSVDRRSARGLDIEAVVGRIRGREGSEVTIGFRRATRPERRFTLTRADITVPVVRGQVVRSGKVRVGHVRLAQFTGGSGAALRKAVKRLGERDVAGYVLDLRGNPGGLVTEALGAASAFLPEDSPVVIIEGRAEPRQTLRTDEEPIDSERPLVVLVDRGSASSSEILAGALRDDGRARLAGQRTFGKALVQTTELLRDGGALKLTTARYRTPAGEDINRRGLAPAVPAADDPATARDEGLARATAAVARAAG